MIVVNPEVLERDQKRLASRLVADRVAESRSAAPVASRGRSRKSADKVDHDAVAQRVANEGARQAQKLSEKHSTRKRATARKQTSAA